MGYKALFGLQKVKDIKLKKENFSKWFKMFYVCQNSFRKFQVCQNVLIKKFQVCQNLFKMVAQRIKLELRQNPKITCFHQLKNAETLTFIAKCWKFHGKLQTMLSKIGF